MADTCIDFYTRVLGMSLERFIGGTPPVERIAFKFGNQKINLPVKGGEFEPNAHLTAPGALDLCFMASIPLNQAIKGCKQRSGLSSRGRGCVAVPCQKFDRFICVTRTST